MAQFLQLKKRRGEEARVIREALENYFSNRSSKLNALSPTVLVDLVRDVCGNLPAEWVREAIGEEDQRMELRNLLYRYAYSKRHGPELYAAAAEDTAPYGSQLKKTEPTQPAKKVGQK